MGKKKEEQGLETFLKSEFLSELKNETPKGAKLLEKYPLTPPFSYANIIQNQDTGSVSYQVDEIKLNPSEEIIYNQLQYNLVCVLLLILSNHIVQFHLLLLAQTLFLKLN